MRHIVLTSPDVLKMDRSTVSGVHGDPVYSEPSLRWTGMEDSTTSGCCVVPSSRLRNATDSRSDFLAVSSSSPICCLASVRFLPCPLLARPGPCRP